MRSIEKNGIKLMQNTILFNYELIMDSPIITTFAFHLITLLLMIILNSLGILLLVIIGLLTLFLLLIPIGTIIPINRKYQPATNGVDIYLSSNGMHTDFIVPTQNHLFNWAALIDSTPFEKDLTQFPYLGIGWGDWNFYIELDAWENLTPKLAARALLNPMTKTLMHVTSYEKLPTPERRVEKISITNQQYLSLCTFIKSGFELNDQQGTQLLPSLGYAANDNFYEGTGSYHYFHTCNYWVNKGLKKIGVRTSLWSPIDRGMFYQLGKVKESRVAYSTN